MSKILITAAAAISLAVLAACQTVDRGSFGTFTRSLNNTAYGYQVVEDPTGMAPTPTVERFEVKPGDCSADQDWSDCANDRERSELSQKDSRHPAGSTYWYGWSMYVPTDYINIFPTKVDLAQFHQDKSHPVWMFQNGDGGYTLDEQVRGRSGQQFKLIDDRDLRGAWHKIEVQAKWSRDSDGFFKVWVNGVPRADYAGPTMSATATYFKYGVYRSFMSRYRNAKGVKDVPGQTVYYANVRRSDSREGLAPAAAKKAS